MNNNTPREIALYIAVYITAFVLLVGLPYAFLTRDAGDFTWFYFFGLVLGVFVVSLVLINFAIERFIYQKIKVLYKVVHKQKSRSKAAEELDPGSDVIGNINKEVLSWARENEMAMDQLKAQEKFRREFIGNLAHELKTPVFTLQGYLLTLLEGGLDDPTINHKYLQRADKNLDRLIGLIHEIDEISKLESGEYELEVSKFNVIELADEVVDELEYKSAKRHISIEVSSQTKHSEVSGDRQKIAQVFTNLITNSIKYGKEGGKTLIRFYDMDENILVEVADDGVGMGEEHLPRLFERFYRVDKSRSREQGGTGLGLAIVKHIIDSHGQSINVRSQPGQGSTFSFTLKKA